MDEIVKYLLNVDGGKALAIVGVVMWMDMRSVVKQIATSLQTLTLQLATVVERVDGHEKRIDRLEDSKEK